MKIFRAVRINQLNQGFDAKSYMKEFYKKLGMSNHGGYDWYAKTGDPIYWDCDLEGTVLSTSTDSSGGLGIDVITTEEGKYHKHRFWHLKGFACFSGEKLTTGTLMGWADNTGNSTGPHLHRELKVCGKNKLGNYYTLDNNNGTYGTIRYDDIFENRFVLETLSKPNQIRMILIEIIKKLIYKTQWQ
jgi:murein DD-endopeptidase MepM/ murein hydrolase activator NlpD